MAAKAARLLDYYVGVTTTGDDDRQSKTLVDTYLLVVGVDGHLTSTVEVANREHRSKVFEPGPQ